MSGLARGTSPRPEILLDENGRRVGDPDGAVIGTPGPLLNRRVIWALPTNVPGGGVSRRYSPSWPQGDNGPVGIDMSPVIPTGAGITSATLSILTNTAPPASSTDFTVASPVIEDRAVYATLGGGVVGRDYQLRWSVIDTLGNQWQRTGLLLCAQTT